MKMYIVWDMLVTFVTSYVVNFTVYPALIKEIINDKFFMLVVKTNIDPFQNKGIKIDNHLIKII